MTDLQKLLRRIADSLNAAQAHYQIWFTLRGDGKALPDYYDEMDDYRYVDFFEASNAGHYKLMYIELGCLFDSDTRAASIRNLKEKLKKLGRSDLVSKIENELAPFTQLVSNIIVIRGKLIAHKEIGADSKDVHAAFSVVPDRICDLIGKSCTLIDSIHKELFGQSESIAFETDRFEKATFELLNVLRRGRS
ncbi:MAG: hypothetical protein V4751_07325 [Pseudomonadota bacterium]